MIDHRLMVPIPSKDHQLQPQILESYSHALIAVFKGLISKDDAIAMRLLIM